MGAFSSFRDNRSKKNSDTPTVEGHYTRLGRIAAATRYAVLAALVVFAVYSFLNHRDEITIENFRYMMKFINIGEEAEKPVGSVISFDGTGGNRGVIYKGDLAVINENGVTVTGWDGDVTLKQNFSYDHPKMLQNGTHLFCYDLGGKELKIFNSYSLLSTASFDYPIYWMAVSQSGRYIAASSAKGYRSAVYVYDQEFRTVYSALFGNKYVDFADISADGREIILAGHYSDGGDILAFLSRYSTESKEPLCEISFIGEIPLGIYYTVNGYALLTSDALRVFNGSDTKIGEIDFSGRKPVSAAVYGDRILISYASEGLSGGTELVLYNEECERLLTETFANSLTAATVCGDKVYALSPGVLTESVPGAGSSVYEIPTSFFALITDGDRLILFSDSEARYFENN